MPLHVFRCPEHGKFEVQVRGFAAPPMWRCPIDIAEDTVGGVSCDERAPLVISAPALVIGIDPGLTGAVAVLPDGLLFDTPTAAIRQNRRDYLPGAMADLLRPYSTDAVAVIEKAMAMPGQGLSSTMRFGEGYGLWIGILAALRIPYDIVLPQRWKRVMMDGMGREKEAARLRALQLFPHLAGQLALKKHHGRAEALLIAEFRRRQEAILPSSEPGSDKPPKTIAELEREQGLVAARPDYVALTSAIWQTEAEVKAFEEQEAT